MSLMSRRSFYMGAAAALSAARVLGANDRIRVGVVGLGGRGSDHLRKFLLEMATGTGKTLLCSALIRRFLQTRNAERVLFIVDRIELAKQTMEDFNVILREYKPVIFKTARRTGELLGSSVVVATIQSLMVDRRYLERARNIVVDSATDEMALRRWAQSASGTPTCRERAK